MRQALLFAVLLAGAACSASRPDIIQVGPWFPAKSAAAVQVFYAREQVSKPFGAIAIIHSEKFPSDDSAAAERQKEEARKLAGKAGADGSPSLKRPRCWLPAMFIRIPKPISAPRL